MRLWPPDRTAESGPPEPAPEGLTRAGDSAAITVSIVSHGHGDWLRRLLPALARTGVGLVREVVLVHNIPDASWVAPQTEWPFRLTEIHNRRPAGFGSNHNRAFERCGTPFFAVLNPDISLDPDASLWRALIDAAAQPGVGCAYPVLLNTDGSVQDNQRAAPTPWALWLRRGMGRVDGRIDWASAAFWLVPSDMYRRLRGFDERFFMYCEDTDFCLRMQLAGGRLAQAPVRATHHAQRSSGRSLRHLAWHVASLWRLWTGRPLRLFLQRTRDSGGSG